MINLSNIRNFTWYVYYFLLIVNNNNSFSGIDAEKPIKQQMASYFCMSIPSSYPLYNLKWIHWSHYWWYIIKSNMYFLGGIADKGLLRPVTCYFCVSDPPSHSLYDSRCADQSYNGHYETHDAFDYAGCAIQVFGE